MSDKEEGKEGDFTNVMSRREKRAAKLLKAKSPSPTPPIPDIIGSNEKKKKDPAKKPRIEEETTSGTSATATSESEIPEKNLSEEERMESEQNESANEQATNPVISPALPAVFLSAPTASDLREEMLPKSNSRRKTGLQKTPAERAEIEIDYESDDRKIGGRVLKRHGTTANFKTRDWPLGPEREWLSKRHGF